MAWELYLSCDRFKLIPFKKTLNENSSDYCFRFFFKLSLDKYHILKNQRDKNSDKSRKIFKDEHTRAGPTLARRNTQKDFRTYLMILPRWIDRQADREKGV